MESSTVSFTEFYGILNHNKEIINDWISIHSWRSLENFIIKWDEPTANERNNAIKHLRLAIEDSLAEHKQNQTENLQSK